ncbi:hypothetical protein [Azospirillum sp.]|uniref:hypothetical protein n=1 Tax=Azospirillum sp. TaxID=34012 RepID=UPI002D719E36|nr:hypothetical protein [Azospirillum sp.]HYD68609.1 hypothetical protein [Azospirillum sp.]
MTFRHIAAATLTATMLLSGTAFAAQTGAGSFEAQLREAKAVASGAGREAASTAATHLSVAESLHARGDEAGARDYLRFARGMLGLSAEPPAISTQVGEAGGQRSVTN